MSPFVASLIWRIVNRISCQDQPMTRMEKNVVVILLSKGQHGFTKISRIIARDWECTFKKVNQLRFKPFEFKETELRQRWLKARSDYSNSAATSNLSSVLLLIGNFSLFTATHCISHWSQQNHCSLNEPLGARQVIQTGMLKCKTKNSRGANNIFKILYFDLDVFFTSMRYKNKEEN